MAASDTALWAVAAVGAASVAASMFAGPWLGMALAAIACPALALLLRGSSPGDLDRHVLRLASGLAESGGRPVLRSLMSSASEGMPFYPELARSVREYWLSGDARSSFAALSGYGSARLGELASIVVNSLESGADAALPARELELRMREAREASSRARAAASGADAVARFGSVLFLPAFAGISSDILAYASSASGSALASASASAPAMAPSQAGFALVLSLSMALANISQFRFSAGTAAARAAKAAAASSAAVAVFRLTAMFAMSALG